MDKESINQVVVGDGVVFERKCERHERIAQIGHLMTSYNETIKLEDSPTFCEGIEEQTFVPIFFVPIGCWPSISDPIN